MIIGVDIGVGNAKSAVSICENRDGVIFLLGSGIADSTEEAYRLAVLEWTATLPWWKRMWERLKSRKIHYLWERARLDRE